MGKKLATIWLSLAAALAVGLATGAHGKTDSRAAPRGDPGVTPTSVLLGGTTPLSGPASAFASVARGAEAYFKYVNARGGVHGRKITYKVIDDAYNPAQTVQATRQLVQQDNVFAIFNSLGTEHNQPVREYLNEIGVPHLFVASGATTWGRDYKRYPWTIGYQPSYISEGFIYGRYITRTRPGARLAILFQNDDYGKDLIAGLKRGLAGKARIVAQEGYEPTASDVQSQVAKLKASGARIFLIFATPKFAIQSFVFANKLGWKPLIIVNVVSSASNIMQLASEGGTNKRVEGAISIVFLKDPTDPKWAKDPAVRLYRTIMRKYDPRGNPKDVYNVYGMAVAYTMVDTLRLAGRNLTRKGVMAATARLNELNNLFLLPGITVKTGPRDRFPIEQAKLQRWTKGRWISFGGLWGYRVG